MLQRGTAACSCVNLKQQHAYQRKGVSVLVPFLQALLRGCQPQHLQNQGTTCAASRPADLTPGPRQ